MSQHPAQATPVSDPPGPAAAVSGQQAPGDRAGHQAMIAVYIAFIVSGFGIATWAARIPQARDALHLQPGTLGLVLLSLAAGSVVALPVAGVVVTRLGAARTVAATSLIFTIGLMTVAIGINVSVTPVVIGLFLTGFGGGTWDVAMNVQGAAVEQRLRRSIMSRFHAGFSIGTVAGALLGAALVTLGVSVTAHLLLVGLAVAAIVPASVLRGFLPAHQPAADRAVGADGPDGPNGPGHPQPRHPLMAWLEPRTLLIGVFVFTMAFTEGTGTDWLAVAVIDGHGAAPATGSLAYAVFVAAMTIGRWYGPGILDRHGRVPALRASALLALIGLLILVFGSGVATAMIGAILWGLGTALGFPVGMSAAADDPAHAPGRVSVVASIGYVAFLAGPPLIGTLGDQVGVLR
ncbi:MAG: MFS transporter, partial [Micromonosporaceae bacterium]|nr:MFS transporter [Micromonosporaceae bacterium]